MRAVVVNEVDHYQLTETADPALVAPTDIVVRVTATTVCGSDLHLIAGHLPTPWGFELGHDRVMGRVEQVAAERVGVARGGLREQVQPLTGGVTVGAGQLDGRHLDIG